MKENTQILLIAFKYPPYAGVGGFRWSKLTKYLAKDGYKIHVVTVNWRKTGEDIFLEDVQHPNIIIHKIPSFYFHNLKYKRYKNTLFDRFRHIMNYAFYKVLEIIWYEDEAQFWGISLLPYCKKLIQEEKIKIVIATGHPFMANYWASKLKKNLLNIRLIQDFQDPWTDNEKKTYPFYYYMKNKSIQHELFALNNCDAFFTVTKGLMNILSKKIYANVKKAVICNGFDIPQIKQPPLKRNFTFIYAGSMYLGREECLEAFLKAVDGIRDNFSEISAQFYGGEFPNILKKKYAHLFTEGILVHYPWISPEQVQKKIHESFACLHFNSRNFPYLVSTKIYEYASLRRPTLSINYGGDIEELIKKHKLGVSVDGDDIKKIQDEILKLYRIWQHDQYYEISPENLEIFHYENLAREVEKYFK